MMPSGIKAASPRFHVLQTAGEGEYETKAHLLIGPQG
jgi:hypothetical protein